MIKYHPEEIVDILDRVPHRILYAAEAGSRAWGYANENSDYDIRMIYARPLQNYLDLWDGSDTYSDLNTIGIDVNGWDVGKALRLAEKSNPLLLEWLNSNTKYLMDIDFYEELYDILHDYTPARLGYHYANLAHTTIKAHLLHGGPSYNLKKLIIAVRAVLAVNYMFLNEYSIPPTNIWDLALAVMEPETLKEFTTNVVGPLRQGVKDGKAPEIVRYLKDAMSHDLFSVAQKFPHEPKPSKERLQKLFNDMILKKRT